MDLECCDKSTLIEIIKKQARELEELKQAFESNVDVDHHEWNSTRARLNKLNREQNG